MVKFKQSCTQRIMHSCLLVVLLFLGCLVEGQLRILPYGDSNTVGGFLDQVAFITF